MSDPQPKMFYTRIMAFMAFFYALWYIETNPDPKTAVLVFLAFLIGQWALGRASLIEGLRIWKGKE
jgi:heme A synthase